MSKVHKEVNLSKVWNGTIESEKDIRDFFYYLIFECKLNFHPDESFLDFEDEVVLDGIMSRKVCEGLDEVMKECFLYCEENMVIKDLYSIGMEVLSSYLHPKRVEKAKTDIIQKFEDFKVSLQDFQRMFGHPSWEGYIDGLVEGYLGDLDLESDLYRVMEELTHIDCDECGSAVLETNIVTDKYDRTVCPPCKEKVNKDSELFIFKDFDDLDFDVFGEFQTILKSYCEYFPMNRNHTNPKWKELINIIIIIFSVQEDGYDTRNREDY
jgi:hypothetical protein